MSRSPRASFSSVTRAWWPTASLRLARFSHSSFGGKSASGSSTVREAMASGPFTGASPFVGLGAGDARVDETRIDTDLRVDPKDADELASKTAGGPAEAKQGDDGKDEDEELAELLADLDEDEEPADATKVDEFRLNDLAKDQTSGQAKPDASVQSADDEKPSESPDDEKAADVKTTKAASGSRRSPKDKM